MASRDDSFAHVDYYVTEDDPLTNARRFGRQAETRPISPSGGAVLRFLTAAIGARAVVEIGTGCGSSGIWLLRGMRPDGILTSVDVVPEYQQSARESLQAAGFAPNRARLIHGRAMDVLPRLNDATYDMVFVDAALPEYPDYLKESLRLLREGGIVAFNNALDANPPDDGPLSGPDPGTEAMRETSRLVREDDRLVPLLLPIGEGMLAAIRGA